MNTLPNDIARCNGHYAEGWREGCETCLRRTAPRPEIYYLMSPPLILAFECESLIEPQAQTNEDQTIKAARRERLNQGLLALASWCQSRAVGDHDIETTLTMLREKAEKLPWRVAKAGADALEEFRDNQTQP
jgi:hypothetical protein